MKRLTIQKISNRKKTHNGMYADIGHVLDNYSTQELYNFMVKELKLENQIRYFIERQIIDHEVNIEKLKQA